MKRKESPNALRRKPITLSALVTSGLLKIGDKLVFTYHKKQFVATLASGPYITIQAHPLHTNAVHVTDGLCYYKSPTNFTSDCVKVYWGNEKSKTNPSGFDRIICRRNGKTLNQLRDAYLELMDLTDSDRSSSVKKPRVDGISSSSTSGYIASLEEAKALVNHLLNGKAFTVATLRNKNTKMGFKQVAYELEANILTLGKVLSTYQTCLAPILAAYEKTRQEKQDPVLESVRSIFLSTSQPVETKSSSASSGGSSSSSSSPATSWSGKRHTTPPPSSLPDIRGLVGDALFRKS